MKEQANSSLPSLRFVTAKVEKSGGSEKSGVKHWATRSPFFLSHTHTLSLRRSAIAWRCEQKQAEEVHGTKYKRFYPC